ncbi:MAG: GNAT family N-acetyltransferase [Gemmatimonadota bacterium]
MIRPRTEADDDAIVEVWTAASLIATPFLSPQFMADEAERIRTMWLPKAETWVYEVEGAVGGFMSLIGNEVGAIFVHPDRQGLGIGRALMDHAVELRGSLVLDVFQDNAIGRRFYDRYGFRFDREHVHEETGRTQLRLTYEPGD